MPIARVQLPDGRIARFEVAEGTPPDQIEAEAAKLYGAQSAPQPAKPAQELTTSQKVMIHAGALRDTWNDRGRYGLDALRSGAMGIADLALGAGQLVSKAMGPEHAEKYNDAMRWVEQKYQEGRESDTPDVGRFAGSMLVGGLLSKAPAAATLGGRMLQGSKFGAMLGLASPVDPGAEPTLSGQVTGQENAPYWLPKAVQVGGGAAIGALAPAAVEGILRGTGAAVNGIVNSLKGMKNTLTGAAGQKNIEAALSAQIEKAGVAWNQVPRDAREMLVNEVRKAIRSGGSLDEESARRLGDFLRVKVQPTQGQLTRDPQQFAREQNYRGTDFGRPLADRFSEQNRQLIGGVDDVRAGTGARGADPYASGQRVISDLRATDAAAKGNVDAAYTQARSMAGLDSEVPAAPIADRLGKIVEEFGDDRIPGAVMKRLNEFGFMGGTNPKQFTIREAEKLKTLIGNNIENPNTPTGKALTLLKQGIDDAMNGIGDDAGAQAAGAFRQARGLATRRFEALRNTPGMEKALSKDVTPEKFLESEIVRGEVKDVANMMMRLGKDARSEVRGAVVDWIRSKGVSGVADTAQFNQAGFNKALQTIGERKLKLIFAGDKEALRHLETLGRVGAYVQKAPVGSTVNTSNTFSSGLDFIDQISRLPGLNLVSGRLGDMGRAAQASSAVGASPALAPTPAIPPALLDRLAVSGGALSVPASANALPRVMENKSRKQAKGKRN